MSGLKTAFGNFCKLRAQGYTSNNYKTYQIPQVSIAYKLNAVCVYFDILNVNIMHADNIFWITEKF